MSARAGVPVMKGEGNPFHRRSALRLRTGVLLESESCKNTLRRRPHVRRKTIYLGFKNSTKNPYAQYDCVFYRDISANKIRIHIKYALLKHSIQSSQHGLPPNRDSLPTKAYLLFGDGSRPHLQRVGHTAGRGRRIIGQRCTVKMGNNSRYRRLRILRTAIPLARAQREQQRENQKQFLHFFSCLG